MQPSFDPFSQAAKERLREGKNLLAFSGGIDSTALFFLLQNTGISFDIAIVQYDLRPEAGKEVAYAKTLAEKFGKRCYHRKISLPVKNFEHEARIARYAFFEEMIRRYGYDTLLTGHQLNDKTEWFLMQFCKGAGAVEIAGFFEIEGREGYQLIRPLIHTPRSELIDFLHTHDITYFQDRTNRDLSYRRNLFRHRFSDALLKQCASGIKKSFEYLEADAKALFHPEISLQIKELTIMKRVGDETEDLRNIDAIVKRMGYLLSHRQREEILRQKESVIAGKIAVCIRHSLIWIAPYIPNKMDKRFKERCRVAKVPPKIRPYLFEKGIDPSKIRYHDDN